MSKFSELLEQYVTKSGLSDGYLARASGFSRSYVTKITNGQRFSSDLERMTKMLDALPLTSTEYNELWNLYMEQLMGKDGHDLNNAVLNFLESFKHISTLPVPVVARYQCEMPEQQIFDSREDICYMTRILIEQEASKSNGHLRLLVQPEEKEVLEALKSGLRMNPDFQVEHLVGLEQCMDSRKEKYYNIQLFQQLIPVILCQQTAKYKIYFHYERLESYFSQFCIMPYYIITGDTVLNIDSGFRKAILWRNPEIHSFYASEFDRLISKSHQLCDIAENVMENCLDQTLLMEKDPVYCMGSQPCVGAAGSDMLFQKYALDINQDVIVMMMKTNQMNRDYLVHAKVTSYFTKAGIWELMTKGRLEEVPSELYRPLEMEDRCMILEKILKLAEEGVYAPHIIDEKKFCYPPGLVIDSYGEGKIVIYYNSEQKEKRFTIKESTLATRFRDFLEKFHESIYVYSVKDTAAFLESVLRQCKKEMSEEQESTGVTEGNTE